MIITKGRIGGALKVVVYGPEGIGKSTLASRFPDPVFIDTEGSTRHLDVARTDPPTSWQMLLSQVDYIRTTPGVCKTLVIDTADWAEQLCITSFCASKQINGIEDLGYGKGYIYIAEDFGKLLNSLEEIRSRGIYIVITAHAAMRKFEQPDELGAYDRWELKLNKKTAALVKEWADVLLFANFKTLVVNVDGKGATKGKNKAQGGKRVLYTSHNPCWDAKNRLGMPEELDMSWDALAPYITPNAPTAPEKTPAPAQPRTETPPAPPAANPPQRRTEPAKAPAPSGPFRKLQDLMDANSVTSGEIMEVVAAKGYFPRNTQFDRLPANFVEGVLVGAWPQVFEAVKALKSTSKGE